MIKTVRGKRLWVDSQLIRNELFTWLAVPAGCLMGAGLGFVVYCVLGLLIVLVGGEVWLSEYSHTLGPFCTFGAGPVFGVLVLWWMRLNWMRWVPSGAVALWDGSALSAFRHKLEKHGISILNFDTAEYFQEARLLRVYLRKVAVAARFLDRPGGAPERGVLQDFIDESAHETAELIMRSRKLSSERDAFIKQYDDKAAALQGNTRSNTSAREFTELINSNEVG